MTWFITITVGAWSSVYQFQDGAQVWPFVESALKASTEENTTVNIKLIKGGNYER